MLGDRGRASGGLGDPLAVAPDARAVVNAAASSTRQNALAGPLSSVLGPGPWPNIMHCPVEITPIVR